MINKWLVKMCEQGKFRSFGTLFAIDMTAYKGINY